MYAVKDKTDGRYYAGASGFSKNSSKASKYNKQDAEQVASELGRNAGDVGRYIAVEVK